MDVAALALKVDSSGVVTATGDLDKFKRAANDAGAAADKTGGESRKGSAGVKALGDEARKTDGALGSLARQAKALGGALAAALSIRAIAQAADAWSDMQSRVGAAVKDMEAAPQLMQRMVDIANASYSPLNQTVEVYSRNVSVLREMGRSADEAADFTEALNNALVITATRGERAASVQNALSKAMAVGKIDAQGLETVLANGGAVAEALAAELDTTVNGLRKMSSEGKITGQVIASSLINRFDELRARAEEMPATMEDGLVRIKNNFVALIGTLDQTYGISQRVAGALLWVADNLQTIATIATIAGAGFLTYRTGVAVAAAAQLAMNTQLGLFIGFARLAYREVGVLAGAHVLLGGSIAGAAAAFKVLAAALLANPFGLIVGSIAAVTALLYANRDAQIEVGNETVRLGDIFLGIWELVKRATEIVQTVFTEGWAAAFAKISPALAAVGQLFDQVFTYILSVVRAHINLIVGLFVGLGAAIKAAFGEGNVMDAFRSAQGVDYVGRAGAFVRQGIVDLANLGREAREASAAVAGTETALGKALAAEDKKKKKSSGKTEAEKFADIVQRAQAEIAMERVRAQAVGMSARAAAELEQKTKLLNAAQSAGIKLTPKMTAELDRLAASYAEAKIAADVAEAMHAFNEQVRTQTRSLLDVNAQVGLYGEALARLRYEQELLNAAQDALPVGVSLSVEQIEGIKRAAAEMASLAESTRRDQFFEEMRVSIDAATFALEREAGTIGLSREALIAYTFVTDQLADAKRQNITLTEREIAAIEAAGAAYAAQRDALDRQMEGLSRARQVVGGFFREWSDGVRNGLNVFKSFVDAVVNGLNRIVDRLLDRTITSFLDSMFAGSTGGGFLGRLLGPRPNALGGAYGPSGAIERFTMGGAFTNQVVTSPTLFRFAKGSALGEMGEAGPEAIMPLKRGPDGSLGVQAHGGSGRPTANITINQEIKLEGAMMPETVVAVARSAGEEAVRTTKRSLEAWLREIDMDGAVAA